MGGGGGGDDDGIEGLSIEDGCGGGKLVVDVGLLVPMGGSVLPAVADGISLSMPGRGVVGVGGIDTERESLMGGRPVLAPGAPFSLRSELRVVRGKPLTLESRVRAASGVVGAGVAGGMPPALLTSLPPENPPAPLACMMPGVASVGFFGGGSMLEAGVRLSPIMPGVAGAAGPGRADALVSAGAFGNAAGA